MEPVFLNQFSIDHGSIRTAQIGYPEPIIRHEKTTLEAGHRLIRNGDIIP
jgi:hypothetical protein